MVTPAARNLAMGGTRKLYTAAVTRLTPASASCWPSGSWVAWSACAKPQAWLTETRPAPQEQIGHGLSQHGQGRGAMGGTRPGARGSGRRCLRPVGRPAGDALWEVAEFVMALGRSLKWVRHMAADSPAPAISVDVAAWTLVAKCWVLNSVNRLGVPESLD